MTYSLVKPSVKSLEEYAVSLVTGMISLKTLENYHIAAVHAGILKDDQETLANAMVWDIRRNIQMYQRQLDSVLEYLPTDFNGASIVANLQKKEIALAKQMTKKPKV